MGKPFSALDSPRVTARLRELGPASDLLWATAVLIGIASAVIAASLYGREQVTSGKFWAYAGLLLRAGLYAWSRDGLRGRGGETLWRLLQLGLVAGALELLIDWALIDWVSNGRLVYLSGNDVVLLGSPIWMPLAWACVITDMGYAALRNFGLLRPWLGTRGAAVVGSLAVGLCAGVVVGLYEDLAYRAGWWEYTPAHAMIGRTCALYIPLGEFFMFLLVLPIAAADLADGEPSLRATLVGGLRFALAIAAGYALSYLLLEFGRSPA